MLSLTEQMVNYFNNLRYVNITAKTIIKAAIPDSPRLFSNAIKFVVTCEPKKATFGPNSISAKTETPSNRTPNSINCLK